MQVYLSIHIIFIEQLNNHSTKEGIDMKKVIKIDVDCANCAEKCERIISEIEGVESAAISFMTQKLTIKAPEEKMNDILKEAVEKISKADPDTVLYVEV